MIHLLSSLVNFLYDFVWERERDGMTINHSGNLSEEYFVAYMKLIMNTCEYSVDRAKEYTFQRLFGLEKESMGQISYQNFLNAYYELKDTNE